MQLEIREERPEAGASILFLTGSVDAATQEVLAARGDALIRGGIRHMLIEAVGLDYVSSSGVSCLFRLREACLAAGGSFGIYGPSLAVRRVLEILRLEEWILHRDRMPEPENPFYTHVARREAVRLEQEAAAGTAGPKPTS